MDVPFLEAAVFELLFFALAVSFDSPRARLNEGTEGVSIERGRLIGEGDPLRSLPSPITAVVLFTEGVESTEEAPPPNAPADFLFVPRCVYVLVRMMTSDLTAPPSPLDLSSSPLNPDGRSPSLLSVLFSRAVSKSESGEPVGTFPSPPLTNGGTPPLSFTRGGTGLLAITGTACLTFFELGFLLLLLPPLGRVPAELVGGEDLPGIEGWTLTTGIAGSLSAFPRCRLSKIVEAVREELDEGGSGVEDLDDFLVNVRVDRRARRVLIRGESRPLGWSLCSGLSSP